MPSCATRRHRATVLAQTFQLIAWAWLAHAARAEGEKLAPEIQLFRDATDSIVNRCVYQPREPAVISGALRALESRLRPAFAEYFPNSIPPEEDIAAVYIGTLRKIAESDEARSAGLTLKALVERSIDGYCRTLDAYSEYADEETARRIHEANNPDYVGIGITFRRMREGFYCVPFPGGTAHLAGVLRDDELLEIDGENVRAMTLLEISARLSGRAGTTVRLKTKHKEGSTDVFEIAREPVVSTPVTFEEGDGFVKIGFRRINERACDDLRQLLRSLGNGRALILDFRGCPGGEFSAAIRIAELFLPEKTVIAKVETTAGREPELSRNRAPYRASALRLLQDELTASGAELIIAALISHRDLVKAESRGEKTYGKGVATRPIKLEGGGILKITDSRVFGPQDEYWDGEGLVPSSEAKPLAP